MNPKLLLGLALILSGSLVGCSTVPGGALSPSAGGKLFSNREAVDLKSNDHWPWQLKYALSERTWNEGGLFLTVHERATNSKWPELDHESTAAIYLQTGGKFKLLKRLTTDGLSCFLKPNIIWVAPKGGEDEAKEQLIQITGLFYGSGALTQEHFFRTVVMSVQDLRDTPDVKLEEVEFTPASESYQFGKDEGLKWESDTFAENGFAFEFLINSLAGKDFSPIGKVTGTYKLERKSDGSLQISMDAFKRGPVKDEDWH